MNSSLRISFVVHGYPPFEQAGTEQHTAQLVAELEQQGHIVQIISATRSPVHQHATELSFGANRHRIVNNIPARPLSALECDPIIRDRIHARWKTFQPDVIHVQHLMFLSADLTFPAPAFLTLHDAWMWCAAGGQERELSVDSSAPTLCSGPESHKCSQCATLWAPQLPKRGQFLIRIAQQLHPLVSTAQLNRLWTLLPPQLRHSFSKSRTAQPHRSPKDAAARNTQMQSLAKTFHSIFAPSQYLADRAKKNLKLPIQIIRHGAHEHRSHIGGRGFIFVGSIAEHKGPHIVFEAWRKSMYAHQKLTFYGPLHDYSLIPKQNWEGKRSHAEILDLLQHSDALIMGSIWPENAPLVITEALSMGCPVIAPRIGGIPEMILDGKNGLLYRPGDIADLTKKIDLYTTISGFNTRPQYFSEIAQQYILAYKQSL